MTENLRETNAANENRVPATVPAIPTLMVVGVVYESENGVLQTRGMHRPTDEDMATLGWTRTAKKRARATP